MMAEDFGTFPLSMFDDLEEVPLDELGVFVMLMGLANDHGLFDGRVAALARRLARELGELRTRIDALVARGLIRFYDAPREGGGSIRVGEVTRFCGYRGQAETRSNPSRRRESAFPLEDGSWPSYRGHDKGGAEVARKSRGTSAEPSRKRSQHGAEPPRKSRGTSAEPSRRASQEEKRGEESISSPSLRSGEEGAFGAAPPPAPKAPEAREQEQQGGDAVPYVEPYVIAQPPSGAPSQRLTREQERQRVAELKAQFEAAYP